MLCSPMAAVAADIYNTSTGILSIARVTVGDILYSDVKATIGEVISVGTYADDSYDTYDASTNRLTIPIVNVGAATYYNVVVVVTLQNVISVGTSCNRMSTAYCFDIFGVQPRVNQIEVFAASDVSQEAFNRTKEVLAAAVVEWASSGRLEYWLIGADESAALALADQYCSRRVSRGDLKPNSGNYLEPCNTYSKRYFIDIYQKIGASAVSSGQSQSSAALTGGEQWGTHQIFASLQPGFSPLFKIQGENESGIILHEYWHSIQASFITTTVNAIRDIKMGPKWFVEGSATAMANFTLRKVLKSGALQPWIEPIGKFSSVNGHDTLSEQEKYANKMTEMMKEIQANRKICPTIKDVGYGTNCTAPIAYSAGAWAATYLMSKFGSDVLLKKFHPNVETLGWEGAFKKTFGMSSADFYPEFEKFLDLPLSQQLKILPTI